MQGTLMAEAKLKPADLAKLTAYMTTLINANAVPTIIRNGRKISIKTAKGFVTFTLSGASVRKEKSNL